MNTAPSPQLINTVDAPTSPTLILENSAEGYSQCLPQHGVGEVSQGAISLRELQAHAAHCHLLMQLAKARCRPELHSAQDEEDFRAWSKAKEEAQAAVLAARRALHKDQEMTMGGEWTDEVLDRSGAYFDVPAGAVRRRMGGAK